MNFSIVIILSLTILSTSCVKEEGEISSADTIGNTSGGTTGSTEIPGAEDPLASQAWHLSNTAQTSFSTGVGIAGEDISIADALDAGFTGEGVRIAVSDTGTDIDHEDLTGTQLVGEHRNYGISNPSLWRSTLPYYIADDAHGTAVAGLIAAEGWNGIGSRGVAPDARYAAFRFVGDYTASEASFLARTIDQTDGEFDIFNYSYGYDQCEYGEIDETYIEALEEGITSLRDGYGASYVQSSGNSFDTNCAGNTNVSDNLSTPALIVVGAVNASGVKSSYSTPGSAIWVSAPGGESGDTEPAMVTTDITGCSHGYSLLTYVLNAFNGGREALNTQCSYTSLMNGTSSAAPVLSGVIALMLQANPLLTWRDVKHILSYTSDKVDYDITFPGTVSDVPLDHPLTPAGDAAGAGYDYDFKWVINDAGIAYSNWYGFGRVNALQAVIEANTYTFPLGTYTETITAGVWDYDSGAIAVTIFELDPDGTVSADPVASTLNVAANLTIESVQIEVSITHVEPADIGIILISPSGTESRILHYNSFITSTSFPAEKVILTNAFYGESSAGAWQIKVIDGDFEGDEGTLDNWKIKINGY